MTTIDLLISLGEKLADVLVILLKKRISKKEKEEAEKLIRQYNQLRESHLDISSVLHQYNQGIVRAISTHQLQDLFPICTHRGYQRIERLYNNYLKGGINQLILDKLDVLSINITTYEVKEMKFVSSDESSYQRAQAFTREVWISSYSDNTRNTQDVINKYWLILEGNTWKIEGADVYVKSG